MRCRSCALASIVVLQALLPASQTFGAPVDLEQATQPPTPPELPAELHSADVPRVLVQRPTRPTPAAATPAPTTRQQQGDGAHVSRAEGSVLRPESDAASGPRATWTEGEINLELKEAVKAARQWVHETDPWAEGSGSRQGRADSLQQGGGQQSRSFPGPVHAGPPDLGDEVFKFVKEILVHPVSWLVVTVVGIGSGAVSVANRRIGRPTRGASRSQGSRSAHLHRKIHKKKALADLRRNE